MSATINIPESAFMDYVSAALTSHLTPEIKDQLLKEAIHNILVESDKGYGRKSLIQNAFERAVEKACFTWVDEHIASIPEFKQHIEDVVTEGVKKWMVNDKKDLAEKVASKITEVFSRDRY